MHAILLFHILLTSTLSLIGAGCGQKPVDLHPGMNETMLELGNGTLQAELYRGMQHRSFDNAMRSIVANRVPKKMKRSIFKGEALIGRKQI